MLLKSQSQRGNNLIICTDDLYSFSVPTQDAFKTLFDALRSRILPILVDLVSSPSPPKLAQAKGLLEGWQVVLRLGRWLGISRTSVVISPSLLLTFPKRNESNAG